jgi:hypothetical protein
MPWYRIFANHGPGHQSSTEFYRWYEEALATKQQREDAWEEAFGDGRYDWPIGDVELCDRLPHHIREQKIEGCRNTIEHARKMLNVLGNTLTKPVIAVKLVTEVVGIDTVKGGNRVKTGFRARLLSEPTVEGPMRDKRDTAVDALLQRFRRENAKIRKARKGATRYSRRSDYAVIVR